MIFRLRWLAAPPFLWAKKGENQFSTFLLYWFSMVSSTYFDELSLDDEDSLLLLDEVDDDASLELLVVPEY